MSDNTTPATSHIAELRDYLAEFAARCRAARWYGALFHTDVCADIVADDLKLHADIEARSYSAEQCDREAAKLIEDAARDGLQDSDLPAIRRALRLVNRSAEIDQEVGNLARV